MNVFNKFFSLSLGYMLCSAAAQADYVGVQDPELWDRGDASSGYIQFDSFISAQGVSPLNGTSNSAGGGVSGTLGQFAPITPPGAVLEGDYPVDNLVYAHTSPVSWSLDATSSSFDVFFLELQVKESVGSGLAGASVFANGEMFDKVTVTDDGSGNAITSFFWSLDSAIASGTAFSVTLANGPFQFTAYDSFTLDLSASAVPLPAAVWLFGSALVGLAGLKRRKARA